MTYMRPTELIMIEAQYPYLSSLCERYRFLEASLEEAVHDASAELSRKAVANRFEDDPVVQFLQENVQIVEDELETTARQLRAILQTQYESRQVPQSVSAYLEQR